MAHRREHVLTLDYRHRGKLALLSGMPPLKLRNEWGTVVGEDGEPRRVWFDAEGRKRKAPPKSSAYGDRRAEDAATRTA